MAQDRLEYRFNPETGQETGQEHHRPPRGEDETGREYINRLDGEDLAAAFRDPGFGRDEAELAWMDPGMEGYGRARAGAMADMALEGLVQEIRDAPHALEGTVQQDVSPGEGLDAGYRERYGENWGDCAVAVSNLSDAVMSAGRNMLEEGILEGNPGLIAEGRELIAYSSGMQGNILEDGRATMELHLAERSIQWELHDAEAQGLEQALERMMEAERSDWPNVRTETQNDHIRERIALSFTAQIRENSLDGNQEAVMQAWDQAQEQGDGIARERAGCVGLALQGAAARILDPQGQDGPMAAAWQGLAGHSPDQAEAGLQRARQMEEGVRAACDAIRENTGNPDWEIDLDEQGRIASMGEACRTLEGTDRWLDETERELRAGYPETDSPGLDDLGAQMGRKALDYFNEAAESFRERVDVQTGDPEWDGLNNHENNRLRAALMVSRFRDPEMLQSLVQQSREDRQMALEMMAI